MSVFIASQPAQIKACYPVMRQLRPHLNQQQFTEQLELQRRDGYILIGYTQDDVVDGVAGFIVGHKLAWGRHVYIDDLVVDSEVQSRGIGKKLLEWIIDFAVQEGCEQIHLDSGVQRFDAHRFYLLEHFSIASHHFCKSI